MTTTRRSRDRRPAAATVRLPGSRRPVDRAAAEEVWASGLCTQVDPDLFFPEFGRADQAAAAKAVCRRCPVRQLCLDVFGDLVDHGVVGGLTEGERRERRRAGRAA
jgi:WhiB family redox-sensing transcriptional regulator